MNLLNENNPFHIFFNKLGDIIIANLMFIAFSLPVVTIGPALSALYFCMLKSVKGEGGGTVKTFVSAFKSNFKQAIGIWLILLGSFVLLYLNINFLKNQDSMAGSVFLMLSYGLVFVFFLLFMYIFPVIATFENKLSTLVKNAFAFAFMHIPSTILIFFMQTMPVYFTYVDLKLRPLYACCWFFFGFGALAYLSSLLFYRMFREYLIK